MNNQRKPTPRLLRLRVTTLEAEFAYDEDESPSLPGMRVYEAEGEEVSQVTGPGLAKCGTVVERRKVAK